MKKFIFISFLFNQLVFSQLSNPNDTIAMDKLGTKVQLENNYIIAEKWNNQLLEICKQRKKLKNLHPKILNYYRASHQTSMLTAAFFEETRGNNKKAVQIQLSILKELENEKNKNNKLIGYVYRIVGNALSLEKEFDKSLEYSFKAIPFAKKDPDLSNLASVYTDIAFIYYHTNESNLAVEYYEKSLNIFHKLMNFNGVSTCLLNIAKIQASKKNIILCKKNIEKSIYYAKKANDINQLSSINFQLGILELNSNPKKSADYFLTSLKLAQSNGHLNNQLDASNELYKYFKKTNQYKQSLFYLEKKIGVDTIINKDENKNAMLKAEFKYETEKKEAQIKSLSQQKKIANLESQRQKTFNLVLVIAIISLLITSYFLFNRYKIKKQNELLKSQLVEAEKTIEAEKKATESELKALKSQMNPHFIFNALSSIQDQFMYGDKVIANEQMGNFTYLTRQILNVSGKKQILLSTEIDILSKYLELEKMRFITDFEYTITCSETIDEDYHEIPPMLIQPFVENSIKHGLLHKSGLKKITIDFELDTTEEFIICTVIDNGIGREKSAEIKSKNQNSHQSFSTKSIEQRLELLNDNLKIKNLVIYEDVFENQIVSGTKVVVNIPLV